MKNLKTEFSISKRVKYFPSTLRRRNLKTQQLPVILDLRLRKTRSGKLHANREVIVFDREAPFSKCFPTKQERKAVVFKFLWFEKRFRKAPFS